jgi:hypothetical protein
MTDEAQAIVETAKLGQEVVKAASGIGGWLAEIVGAAPKDAFGLIGGGWLAHIRRRNLGTLEANTAAHLERISADRRQEPSPSILLPLLEYAKDESREELQSLWAALLANSMTDGGRRVRRAFFEVVAELEPQDVVVLVALEKAWPNVSTPGIARDPGPQGINALVARNYPATDYEVSLAALITLGCLGAGAIRETLTPFGRALLAAVTVK